MSVALETGARAAWAALVPRTVDMFAALFAAPELSALEFRTMATLADWLDAHGFDTERGVGGVPTAFRARKGSGSGPTIGILAEYDALPGLDNAPVARRTCTSRQPGHGCGHNHIGPANTAAAIAAAAALVEAGHPGEIVVVGCPAEEIVWGKLALQEAGVFDDLDVILTSHGDYQNGALSRPCYATANGEFRFSGEAAHSGMSTKRNALAAAQAALVHGADRLAAEFDALQFKYVFRFAGFSPGVTPDEVRVWCSLRHADFDTLVSGYARMEALLAEIAAANEVGFRGDLIAACRGYLPNDVMGQVLAKCLDVVGPPVWSPDDIGFMEQLGAACTPDRPFALHRDLAYFDTGIDYYGQDDGDISWRIPLGRVNWAYPETVPIHHWAWTALSGHPAAHPGPLMASEALAIAAVRLAASPQTIAKAQTELAGRVDGITLAPPMVGLHDVLIHRPQAFWDATW